MKRHFFGVLVLAASLGLARAQDGNFSTSLSPEELAAAGIAGLTPAQSARLNALVEAYKSGALATARRAADEAVAARRAAEAQTQAARAEAVAAAARADAAKAEAAQAVAVKPESAPHDGLLARARSLLKSSGKSAAVEKIESTLPGKFRGWESRQILTLANGQRYRVADNQSYYSPPIENPRVEVSPGTFAGFWLRFPDLGAEVRVEFIGDK